MLLAWSDLNQSVGKPFFLHFKLKYTNKKSIGSPREKNSQLPVAIRVSKTSMLKLPNFFFGGGGVGGTLNTVKTAIPKFFVIYDITKYKVCTFQVCFSKVSQGLLARIVAKDSSTCENAA